QAGPVRSGEGVGLEPGDVDDGPRGVKRLIAADAPLAPVVCPVQRVGDVVLLLPVPGLIGPPFAALVAAALDEVEEGGIRDRRAADAKGRDVHRVARTLVVVGEALGRRAHVERPARNVEPLQARRGGAGALRWLDTPARVAV